MSELQSFFEPSDQSQTRDDLPARLAVAARGGDLDRVRRWLAAGGSPDASTERDGKTLSLLEFACASGRPANAEIVGLLCAAGVTLEGPGCRNALQLASKYGAEAAVRHLLRAGVNIGDEGREIHALHNAVMGNNWELYRDPWSIAHAKNATSLGHQSLIRMLLAHGAAVDAHVPLDLSPTALQVAALMSGFVSLGVVKELLKSGASLDVVNRAGRTAEDLARECLNYPIYTGDGIPENPHGKRRPGAIEAFLALLADVRAAGSFKRYANAPRIDVVVLQALCVKGRAVPPPALERLFPTSTRSQFLPREIFWRILSYLKTDRDP